MSEPLIIWLPEDLDDAWAYYGSDMDQGWAATDEERLALSGKAIGNCIIVCPGTWFRVFPHSLPQMKAAERLPAAGYAIEEKLAAPLDEQHIVLGVGEDQRVGVVSKEFMTRVMDRLDQAKIVPSLLVAEFEAFQSDAGTLVSWNRTIHPGPMGYSLDGTAEGDNPLSLMPSMTFEGALNYGQGHFARRQSSMPKMQALSRIAAAFLIAGLTWLIWQGAEARAMNRQVAQLKTEAAELYTNATGKAAPVNPAITVAREIRRGGTKTADFMTMSTQFFAGLQKVDNISVETLRYNETRGQLTLKLSYPNFDAATQLEQIFASGAGNFEPGSVREQNGELIGDAVFTMGDPS